MRLNWKLYSTSPATNDFITPDISQLKFSNTNNDGKMTFETNGTIKLVGADYDLYKTLTTYQIRAYSGDTLYFYSDQTATEIQKENVALKQIDLKIKAYTIYTDKAWTNYDKEYNINELTPEAFNLYFLPGHIPVVSGGSQNFSGTLTVNLADLSPYAKAGYDIDYMTLQYSGTWSGTYSVINVIYKRQQAYGYYIGTGIGKKRYDPDGVYPAGASWTYLSDLVLTEKTLPLFKKNITPIYTPNTPIQPYANIYNTADFYNKPAIEYVGVTRLVYKVIHWLVGKMGLTLSFDLSSSSTDSFHSFKTMDGENMTKGGITTHNPYYNLLIANLTDIVPASDNGQKDVIASETFVSLKTILEYFETLGFFWYIENRLGTNYFILEHKSYKTLGSSNPLLSNYHGYNFLKNANVLEKEPAECHAIRNNTVCKSIDFIGTDMTFTKVYTTDEIKTIEQGQVYTDMNDIANRRHDVYSETDNNNVVIIAAQRGLTKYYVRDAVGKRTLSACNNSELSWSFISEELIAELPDATYTVNGGEVTAASWQLKKRDKMKFTIPITDIQTDWNYTDSVEAFGTAEIESINQNATDNVGELIIMK